MSKKYYQENKEYFREQHRLWRENNPKYMEEWRNKNPEYDKERYRNNKEKLLKQHQEWLKDNPEYQKKWRKENSEICKRIDKKYNKTEKGKINQQKKYKRMQEKGWYKKWQKTEKGKANNQRGRITRQARERKIINTLTAQEWLDILKQHNFKCVYCGRDLFDLFTRPERDHVIPISRGGNNTKENVVPACRNCNAKKYNKILIGGR